MNRDLPTVAEVVAKLQTEASADHLALFFHAQQIQGDIGESRRCPVARYISRETGQLVSVGGAGVVPLHDGVAMGRAERVMLDDDGPIPEFISRFDRGSYPKLVAE